MESARLCIASLLCLSAEWFGLGFCASAFIGTAAKAYLNKINAYVEVSLSAQGHFVCSTQFQWHAHNKQKTIDAMTMPS